MDKDIDIYIEGTTSGMIIRTNKGFISIRSSEPGYSKEYIIDILCRLLRRKETENINFIVEPYGVGMSIIDCLKDNGYEATQNKKVLFHEMEKIL